jgi:hypothetical protein
MSLKTASSRAEFISIKDAALRYQKAEITIRRFVRSVLTREKAADRQMIHPLPGQVTALRKTRKQFVYTIAEELLEKQYGGQSGSTPSLKPVGGSYLHLLERTNVALEEQLRVKDDQIRVLSKAMDDLSERQRETNILMRGLQERLLLPAPVESVVEGKLTPVKKHKRKRRWWRW